MGSGLCTAQLIGGIAMTVNEIDTLIADWDGKQALIQQNLKGFVELPAFAHVAGSDGQPRHAFTGQTLEKLTKALDVFRGLLDEQRILGSTLDRAKQLRVSLSKFMPSKQSIHELEKILNGSSIRVGSQPTPPQRRELLRDIEQSVWVTPNRFLEIMLDSFRFVRDTVLDVAAAQEKATATLQGMPLELARLRGLDHALGGPAAAQLSAATQALGVLAAGDDPLGAIVQCQSLIEQVKSIAAQLESLGKTRREIGQHLADADALLAEIRQARDQGRQAHAERLLKIQSNDPGHPSDDGALDDGELPVLESWLGKLRATVEKGEIAPANIGLQKWRESAEAVLARDRAVIAADQAALRARRELRGLFEALEAKAANRGKAEDPQLTDLAHELRRLFVRRPTPMEKTRQLVARYQERLL
jgi:hypothetical protein